MLFLGIDCSEFGFSVALVKDHQLIMEQTSSAAKKASKYLVSDLKQLFTHCESDFSQVDGVAVAYGPGSFTGLKIGVTAAKVIAEVNQAKLFGISSLKNLAFPLLETGRPVLSLLSARHHNYYAGIYQKHANQYISLLPDEYANFSVLKTKINQFKDLLIVGSGLELVADELDQIGTMIDVKKANLIPRGYSTILLSQSELPIEPNRFIPNYLRDPQAVLVWEKNNPDHENLNYVEEI